MFLESRCSLLHSESLEMLVPLSVKEFVACQLSSYREDHTEVRQLPSDNHFVWACNRAGPFPINQDNQDNAQMRVPT